MGCSNVTPAAARPRRTECVNDFETPWFGIYTRSCGLSDNAAIATYIPAAASALGGIDILTNNATGYGRADDEASWEVRLSVETFRLSCVRPVRRCHSSNKGGTRRS